MTLSHLKIASVKRLPEVLSALRRQKPTLRKDDCRAIASLMENGFSLQDSMMILEEEGNRKIFSLITERLQHGEQLSSFFHLYAPLSYRGYFEGFIRYMPFLESLTSAIGIIDEEEKEKKAIVRGMIYPTVLFAGMLAGIWLFNTLVLPNMITLLEGFHMDGSGYEIMEKFLETGAVIALLLMAVLACGIVFCLLPKNIVRTYCILAKRLPNCILVQYASSEFARFYLECEKRNVSTVMAMKILRSLREKPLVAYIAQQMDAHLDAGESMEEAIASVEIEEALMRFFRIALYSSECEKMLAGYLDLVHLRTQQEIARYSMVIQLISYSAIGIVLVFVYRILMMPMSMLQNI